MIELPFPMKSFLALLTVIATVLGFAQTPPIPASPARVYENKEFGISFTIPEGWTPADDAARENYAKLSRMSSDQHLVLLLTDAPVNQPSERILLIAQQAPKGKYFTTMPEQYLDSWAVGHPALQRITDRKQQWVPDWPASVAWFKSKTAPERWYELLAAEHQATFLRIQGEFNSEESMNSAERTLIGFKFAPDWKSPDEQITVPPGDKPKLIRVSQGVTQGLLIHKVPPHYPEDARRARLQGTVVLQAIVNTRGYVVELRVISSHPMLIDETLKAVSQWRYKPYLLNGEPVDFETQVTVNYTLG